MHMSQGFSVTAAMRDPAPALMVNYANPLVPGPQESPALHQHNNMPLWLQDLPVLKNQAIPAVSQPTAPHSHSPIEFGLAEVLGLVPEARQGQTLEDPKPEVRYDAPPTQYVS